MVDLFGRTWSRKELTRYAGNLDQIGGVQLVDMADGAAQGLRSAQFNTGNGLLLTCGATTSYWNV